MAQQQWERLHFKTQDRWQRRAVGVERCFRGRASSIPGGGDNKNMVISIRHSNKLCMNTAVLMYIMGGCVSGWGAVCTAARGGIRPRRGKTISARRGQCSQYQHIECTSEHY